MRHWLLAVVLGILVFVGAVVIGARRRAAPAGSVGIAQAALPTDPASAARAALTSGHGSDHGSEHGSDHPGASTGASTSEQPGGHAGHGGAAPGAVDWSRVTGRDLDVASVFITARESGVRRGLDRLRALTARDRELSRQGHVVAHALGRFAVAQRGFDPAVYAECREDFQAGCYHGVLEAYFTSPRAAPDSAVSPRALDALCPAIVAPGSPRLPSLECAHGMGHGLTARARNDLRVALRGCDALSDREARGECHDGVFMENAVQGLEPADAARDTPLLRRADPRYPCDSVAVGYQPACWKYQPMIAIEFTNDLARTVRLCDEAPAASVASCFHGIGKQAIGWVSGARDVVDVCRQTTVPLRLDACLAGAAESYIDERWTADAALALCRAAPEAGKAACYSAVGARMALIRASAALVARDCAGAERGWVDVCVQGAAPRPRT